MSKLRRRSVHTARLVGLAQLLSRVVIKTEFQLACFTLACGTCFLITVPFRCAFLPHYTYGDAGTGWFTALDCLCDAFFLVQLAHSVRLFLLNSVAQRSAARSDLARAGWGTSANESAAAAHHSEVHAHSTAAGNTHDSSSNKHTAAAHHTAVKK
jgi:hypothetical protein